MLSQFSNWPDADANRFFSGTAPELINPHTFVHEPASKATDMFAFGVLAWEVSWAFVYLKISRYSPASVVPRSSPEIPRLLEGARLR